MEALTTHLTKFVALAAAFCAAAAVLATSAIADSGSATASGIERQLYAPTARLDPSALRDSIASPGHLGSWARMVDTPVSGIERQLVVGSSLAASALRDSSTDAGHLGRAQASPTFAEPGDGFAWGRVGAGVGGAIALLGLTAAVAFIALRRTRHEPKQA